ncbi:tripartite tricarboxylate transporter TctB family protein [Vibrio sp. SS-MA-C1-2]|uniref:tripartite tricarboxylate transporter TctB family protein n=1 Tax=Vibrio sp. SS-MA-C1-2 TaxID=2908646 RepID=UPI001F2A4F51|nr:tripartite tricarboxylate transporter TctB family protein [Vibrio sp. SS-MA-C1-2]UJF17901.1 tripartite tricarboxylate transporter TctB family protein [Vibrio sp. SS-MA-C1-2]
MNFINRDSVVGLILLMGCGLFINALGSIERTNYGTITSDVWPTIILSLLTILCVIYFVTSLKSENEEKFNWKTFFPRNVLIVFSLFGMFVYTLPYLGMLIGGSLFVFTVLTMLGHKTLKYLFIHLVIAIGSVAVMYIVFTYGLSVFLPEGELLYSLMY